MKIEIDDRELATILAALRMFQRNDRDFELTEIQTDNGLFTALSDEEIDTLCERINSEFE